MTNIEWCKNPPGCMKSGEVWEVTSGCSPVSEGCAGCFAARLVGTRLKHHPDYEGLARFSGVDRCSRYAWTGEVRLLAHNLEKPLHWRTPRMVFVNSKSDLFHPSVPADYITRVYETMSACPQHEFFVCTKRPERIVPVLYGEEGGWYLGGGDYIPNVIHLTSVENQAAADERIPELLKLKDECSAWRIGISAEPLIGPVWIKGPGCWACFGRGHNPALSELFCPVCCDLDFVIVGAESGPNARPCDPAWIADIVAQCQAAGVAVFVRHPLGGKADWPEELGIRQWPKMRKINGEADQ